MLWPYPFGARRRATPACLDRWLPPGAWRLEHHAIDVAADPATALGAMGVIGFGDLPAVRVLFSIRGLPHDGKGSVDRFFRTPPFVALDEEPGRELVFGVVGPFWRWGRGRRPPRVASTPDELRALLADGCMAALGNFRVEPTATGTRLWTETWVVAPAPGQKLLFLAYWLVVGPFSAWIRRLLLRAARRHAVAAKVTGAR